MRGWNDDEVVDFARLTLEQPFDVRFIELMPINWSSGDDTVSEMQSYFPGTSSTTKGSKNTIVLYAKSELPSFRDSFHGANQETQVGELDSSAMRRAFISTHDIKTRIESTLGPMTDASVITNGPSRAFKLHGASGTIGFISQITNDMCKNCNRLRLTADGMLRPCLMADGEVDLRRLLRSGAGDGEIEEMFRLTVLHKPLEHRLEDGLAPVGRNMSQLGG